MEWKELESRVRRAAGLLWSKEAEETSIAGINLDCVVKFNPTYWIIIEISVDRDLDKLRGDTARLNLARQALFQENIFADCYFITDRAPTPAMVNAGKPFHINVRSVAALERSFFDYPSYVAARSALQFGSAVNPLTGEPDNSEYVPVAYREDGSSKILDLQAIAALLTANRKIVLLGEYGSGKSRCLRELFNILSVTHAGTERYFISIDLRTTWGLRSGPEIIRRHFDNIGLAAKADRIIRAYHYGAVCFLLDGFDEVGSQSWSDNPTKLQNIRYESLSGVRDLLQNCSGGCIVGGREHYFNSHAELFRALGLREQNVEAIRCNEEFNDSELEVFLQRFIGFVVLPEWLPRRPLMCQVIASLESNDLTRMFGQEGGDVEFWQKFIDVVCEREARIRGTLDADTIFRVLQTLSGYTRTKSADVGPISFSEIQRAFEEVLGRQPIEEASLLLQRLPGLGRTESESDDRKFIDTYILDGLRACNVFSDVMEEQHSSWNEDWINPLNVLGQRVLGHKIAHDDSQKRFLRYANRCISGKNKIMAGDIAASLLRGDLSDEVTFDYEGLILQGTYISELDMSGAVPTNLAISDSILETIQFPQRPISGVSIRKCASKYVFGITDARGLPDWVEELAVEKYESVTTVSAIKNVKLSPNHRVLVTILKKTYLQKGGGRQEEALVRGLGQIDRQGKTEAIINLLLREDLLETFRGDHGRVFLAVAKQRQRVGSMLAALNISTDPIWQTVAQL
jgi:hypothetical protein